MFLLRFLLTLFPAPTFLYSFHLGVLVPGGFGDRGVEGKVLAINYARVNNIPFFGICMGLQLAVVEYARNVLGIKEATSAEFDESSEHAVVVFMPEISSTHKGATMRLGARRTMIKEGSIAHDLYKSSSVMERHRHRYEVSIDLVPQLEQAGLVFSGKDERQQRMEIVELPSSVHPFYLGTQYHPEFLSRPTKPSPPFFGFIRAAGVVQVIIVWKRFWDISSPSLTLSVCFVLSHLLSFLSPLSLLYSSQKSQAASEPSESKGN